MNMQAMMKQAQKLQRDMMESSLVTVTMNGQKELLSVNIEAESLDKEDIEMLQDMIMVAMNDAMKQVNKVVEEKMGAYTKGMPGLF